MVVDHLPLPTLTAVDVGDAVLDRDPLACQRDLPLLYTDLVGQICTHADQLIGQPNLSPTGEGAYLVERRPHLFPALQPLPDGVHGSHIPAMRPGRAHRAGITAGHTVQRRIEPIGC